MSAKGGGGHAHAGAKIDSELRVAEDPRSLFLWFLVGNGGMDSYDSPLRSPIVVPITHSPIPY